MIAINIWSGWQFVVATTAVQTAILIWMAILLNRNRKAKLTGFWAALQTRMVDLLHHPDPRSHKLDKLLEELEALTLTPERTLELEDILERKAKNPKESKDERNRAEFLLIAMREVVLERAGE